MAQNETPDQRMARSQERVMRLELENSSLKEQIKGGEFLLDWLKKFNEAGGKKADLDKFLADLQAKKKEAEALVDPGMKAEDKKEKEEEKKAENKGSKPSLLGQIFGDFKKLLS